MNESYFKRLYLLFRKGYKNGSVLFKILWIVAFSVNGQ